MDTTCFWCGKLIAGDYWHIPTKGDVCSQKCYFDCCSANGINPNPPQRTGYSNFKCKSLSWKIFFEESGSSVSYKMSIGPNFLVFNDAWLKSGAISCHLYHSPTTQFDYKTAVPFKRYSEGYNSITNRFEVFEPTEIDFYFPWQYQHEYNTKSGDVSDLVSINFDVFDNKNKYIKKAHNKFTELMPKDHYLILTLEEESVDRTQRGLRMYWSAKTPGLVDLAESAPTYMESSTGSSSGTSIKSSSTPLSTSSESESKPIVNKDDGCDAAPKGRSAKVSIIGASYKIPSKIDGANAGTGDYGICTFKAAHVKNESDYGTGQLKLILWLSKSGPYNGGSINGFNISEVIINNQIGLKKAYEFTDVNRTSYILKNPEEGDYQPVMTVNEKNEDGKWYITGWSNFPNTIHWGKHPSEAAPVDSDTKITITGAEYSLTDKKCSVKISGIKNDSSHRTASLKLMFWLAKNGAYNGGEIEGYKLAESIIENNACLESGESFINLSINEKIKEQISIGEYQPIVTVNEQCVDGSWKIVGFFNFNNIEKWNREAVSIASENSDTKISLENSTYYFDESCCIINGKIKNESDHGTAPLKISLFYSKNSAFSGGEPDADLIAETILHNGEGLKQNENINLKDEKVPMPKERIMEDVYPFIAVSEKCSNDNWKVVGWKNFAYVSKDDGCKSVPSAFKSKVSIKGVEYSFKSDKKCTLKVSSINNESDHGTGCLELILWFSKAGEYNGGKIDGYLMADVVLNDETGLNAGYYYSDINREVSFTDKERPSGTYQPVITVNERSDDGKWRIVAWANFEKPVKWGLIKMSSQKAKE